MYGHPDENFSFDITRKINAKHITDNKNPGPCHVFAEAAAETTTKTQPFLKQTLELHHLDCNGFPKQ